MAAAFQRTAFEASAFEVPAAYAITLNSGNYSVTGNAIQTIATRRISVTYSSYVANSGTTQFAVARTFIASAENYVLVGKATLVAFTRHILLTTGVLTVDGSAVGLQSARRLKFDGATTFVTGSATTARLDRVISPSTILVALTGQTQRFITARTVSFNGDTYDVVGNTASFRIGIGTRLVSKKFFVIGKDIGFRRTYHLPLAGTSVTVAPIPVLFLRGSYIQIGTAAASTVGASAGLHQGRYLRATGDTATVSGTAAQIIATRVLLPAADIITLSGGNLRRQLSLLNTGGEFAFIGQSTTLLRAAYVAAATGSVGVIGNTLSLVTTRSLGLSAGHVQATGLSVSVRRQLHLSVLTGSLEAIGRPTPLSVSRHLATDVGSVLVVGNSVKRRLTFHVNGKPFTYSGRQVRLRRGLYVGAVTGSYIQTGRPINYVRTHIIRHDRGGVVALPRPVSLTYQSRLKLIRINYFVIGSALRFYVSSFVGDGPEVINVQREERDLAVPSENFDILVTKRAA